MSSFSEAFYLDTSSPWRRGLRNVRLLGYILSVVWFWAVRGAFVRRAIRSARTSGNTYRIDHLA